MIKEEEYRKDFEGRKTEIARLIAFSGLTIAEIARATRMKWDTIYAISQRRSVRLESFIRVEYFLRNLNRDKDGI